MKQIFIEAKRKLHEGLIFDFKLLPKRIGLLSTVQFLPIVEKVEGELKKSGKKVEKSKTLFNETQILGCNISSAEKIKDKVDAFLLLSSGKWHALMLSSLGKPVFIYNGRLESLSEEDVSKFNARKRAAAVKFLSQDIVGIIVSLKPGQYHLEEAVELKKRLEKKGADSSCSSSEPKKAFIFISETLNPMELENFDIRMFINTACPGLFFDSSNIINIKDIPKSL